MSEFKVKLSGLVLGMSGEQRIRSSLDPLGDDLRSVQRELNLGTDSQEELKKSLKKLADTLDGYENDMKTMHSVLVNVKDQYEKAEWRVREYKSTPGITADDVWKAVTTTGMGLAISVLSPTAGLVWITGTILSDAEWENEFKAGFLDHELKKTPKDWKKVIRDDHYEYDEKSGKLVKKEKGEEKEDSKKKKILDSIKFWSGGYTGSNSLLHFGGDDDVETDWGSYSASADFMKAEASATAYVGAGGAGFDVGVALTALSGGLSGQLGNEDLGVHGSVQVDIGKVSVSAGGAVEIWDENGDFKPKVGFSAEAEAIAAEVSGEAGIDFLGTKGSVKGSLNVGIGGHADVGFTDGKLSLDIGASLGVGGSLSLEIDVSGTIDKAVEHAAEIGDAAWDACEAAASFVADAADKAGSAISGFGKEAGNMFKAGWSNLRGIFK